MACCYVYIAELMYAMLITLLAEVSVLQHGNKLPDLKQPYLHCFTFKSNSSSNVHR